MSEEIKLASPEEIAALIKTITSEPEPTKRTQRLQKINAEYEASEKKRKLARPWIKKPAERLARERAEDERFAQKFEKFEDKNYYGLQIPRYEAPR